MGEQRIEGKEIKQPFECLLMLTLAFLAKMLPPHITFCHLSSQIAFRIFTIDILTPSHLLQIVL